MKEKTRSLASKNVRLVEESNSAGTSIQQTLLTVNNETGSALGKVATAGELDLVVLTFRKPTAPRAPQKSRQMSISHWRLAWHHHDTVGGRGRSDRC